ncbi:uncharacterized protein LOC141588607 [Silene latifolia]|uniref:uncharacterized protein LOC141588607 n=1 Tax=Silene latifolia TaxID=37657 RepID=UPI003D76CA9C
MTFRVFLSGLKCMDWISNYGGGGDCLRKISSVVGKYVKSDDATQHRNFLGYARTMVEVNVSQEFPSEIVFTDENDKKPSKGPIQHKSIQQQSKVLQRPVQKETTNSENGIGIVTPVIVTKLPKVEQSMPRRILTRMMRQTSGERRSFTPGGLSFMEALSQSIEKIRHIIVEKGKCNVKDNTEQTIHAEVHDKLRSRRFWFTLVYGFNKAQERVGVWNSMRTYHSTLTGPWLACGDFNSVMYVNERIKGAEVTKADIMPMVRVTQDCNLHDLKGNGSFYTWNNKHEHGGKVYSRIDRALINVDWLNEFPDSVANFLPEGLFDHCPCLINFKVQMIRRPAAFKYYNMWALAKNFEEMVSNHWNNDVQSTHMFRVISKLKSLKSELKNLNKEQFSDIENLTNIVELALKGFQVKLMKDPLNEELCQTERACATEFGELVKARNMYLRQKAKMAWVAPVNKRIVKRGKCLNEEHRTRMLAPVSDLEIKEAMFDIPGNKAPGPDGYGSQFFKDAWHIVGGDMCRAIRDSIELIMQCVSTPSYCMALNGEVFGFFQGRGGKYHWNEEGAIPFRYRRVNVAPKRLSVLDCNYLVEKVARIFILPKTVLWRIEAVCRGFLWHGTDQKDGPALVAWDNICKPTNQGGLGFKKLYEWNVASVGKYVWWIENKADHLWVKWVHEVYIKSRVWEDYEPTLNSSWTWHKICQVKEILKPLNFCTQGTKEYTVKKGYEWISPTVARVPWFPWVNITWMLPRHRFLVWLIAQRRLLTKNRLQRMMITQCNVCFLCGLEEEDHEHLFFKCVYSRFCRALLISWCKVDLPLQHCVDWWLH